MGYHLYMEVAMKISIGSTLGELRRAKKLMQKDVAAKLSDYGIDISTKTIHNWEKENALPNARQFIALCDIYGVDDVLWHFYGKHKGLLAGLNQDGRDKVREFINMVFQIEAYRDEPDEVREPTRLYRLYDMPVSAGTGNFLDDSGYEMIKALAYVPDAVDFALRVSGNSMIPQLQDGQIIWVREQPTVNPGEIGIFAYSGDVYCKELFIDGDTAYLKSLNPEYEDIEIKEDFGFKTIGKVVS